MSKLLSYALNRPVALDPRVYSSILAVLERHAAGDKVDPDEVRAIVAKRDQRAGEKAERPEVIDGIAVIPVTGVIARHAAQVDDISQPAGSSVAGIRAQLSDALADPDVHSLLLDIDSPGGAVSGITELADDLFAARKKKPLYAFAEGMVASAAYWLAAQAQALWITKGTQAGNVGVIAEVRDDTGRQESQGVRRHVLASSKTKAAHKPPIDDEDLAVMQREIDAVFAMMKTDVGRGRGVSGEALEALSDGGIEIGAAAKRKGFVDDIKTFDEAVSAIQRAHRASQRNAAASGAQRNSTGPTGGTMGDETNNAPQVKLAELSGSELTKLAPKGAAELLSEGARAERGRIEAIRKMAIKGQDELAETLIAEGRSEDEARKFLHEDLQAKHAATLSTKREDRKPVDETYTEAEGARPPKAGSLEDQAKVSWAALSEMERRAYRDFDAFWALYKRDPDFAEGKKKGGVQKTPARGGEA